VVAGEAKLQSQVAWDKMGQDISTAKEGCLLMNNLWKLKFLTPHFGHPGKVRYFQGHSPGFRLVKIYSPNPKFVDGTWISREGDMEVTLYVPQNKGKSFEELFEGYAKGLGITGSVEFVSGRREMSKPADRVKAACVVDFST